MIPGLNQISRVLAALFGALALIGFFQPWVSASLPGIGESVFTGREIAGGNAADRVDAASVSLVGVGGAGAGGGSLGGLVLPTRQPTTVPGASAGGLVLPTRIATPAPAPAAGGASVGAGAAAAGGLVLPTRIATAAPGTGSGAGVVVATAAAATAQAFSTAQASGQAVRATTVQERTPDRLPGLSLYLVPLAAAGLAIFAALWGRFTDPKDQLYGKVWTILLAAGGALGVGSVLYKVVTAQAANNLLAPGDVTAAMWGIWATFLGFLLAGCCLVVAWLAPLTPARTARSSNATASAHSGGV